MIYTTVLVSNACSIPIVFKKIILTAILGKFVNVAGSKSMLSYVDPNSQCCIFLNKGINNKAYICTAQCSKPRLEVKDLV